MAAVVLCWTLSASAAPTPSEQIREMVDAVVTVLRDPSLSFDDKDLYIRRTVDKRFDFEEMSRRTLPREWSKATGEEQDRFVDLFREQLARTYRTAIEEYSDERVEITGEKIKKDRFAQVDTFILSTQTKIPVNYRLYFKNDEWWVYDVVVEGASLIRNYRTTYENIVKREGMSSLIAQLEEKLQ